MAEATGEAGMLSSRVSLFQEAVAAEQKSLERHVDRLLSWLSETEAQMDKKEATAEEGDGQIELAQQLDLCEVIPEKQEI